MANWDLFREMDRLRKEVDSAFNDFGFGRLRTPAFLPGVGSANMPRINLSEDENNFYIEALVPGLDPKDLELSVMQGTITLSGERKEERGANRVWHRRERGAGKFMRTIELPTAVDNEKVEAEYRNGMLLVTLPKAESVKAKRISVKAD
jgi:HSP20 family protein